MIEWKDCWKKPVKVQYREVDRSQGDVELIRTREGNLLAEAAKDFIIKGVQGEEYPIKKDIFALTYTTENPNANASRGATAETLHGSISGKSEDVGETPTDPAKSDVREQWQIDLDEAVRKGMAETDAKISRGEPCCPHCGLPMSDHDDPDFCPPGTEEGGGRR